VTTMVCTPAGVPVVPVPEPELCGGDDELQADSDSKPTANKRINREVRRSWRCNRHKRRGDRVRQIMPAHAMACNGLAMPRRLAVVRAVVVIKKVDCRDDTLETVPMAGENRHVSPAVSVPQEMDIVPL